MAKNPLERFADIPGTRAIFHPEGRKACSTALALAARKQLRNICFRIAGSAASARV
ncbi:MAG: hypothetical protein M0Z81_03580 [Deltaproteobacteria bacterium]|nr:hypothetical protein [Deltaproteobacteria bacterium]